MAHLQHYTESQFQKYVYFHYRFINRHLTRALERRRIIVIPSGGVANQPDLKKNAISYEIQVEHILDILKGVFPDEKTVTFIPSEMASLDFRRFTEYKEDDQHSPEGVFENPLPQKGETGKAIKVMEFGGGHPTILWFFLDGSRRTYKVCDVLVEQKRFLPVVAGQVGVAVMGRVDGDPTKLRPLRDYCTFKNVIVFPNKISKDDCKEATDAINAKMSATGLKFEVLTYEMGKENKDPIDLGIAKITHYMHLLEIETVKRMTSDSLLGNQKMLVLDGPLSFMDKLDVVQFRNVIGLSKSFRQTFEVGKGRKKMDIGSFAHQLLFGERTCAFKTIASGRTIGLWYLRLRSHIAHPLEGVVKIECFASDNEKEDGIDRSRLDAISAHLLRERNVSPFQSDSRWASHIYPIYLAEKYLKSNFISDLAFNAIF